MDKILVTGAGGFVGQSLIRALTKDYQIRAFDKRKIDFIKDVKVIQGDLSDF